MEESIQQQHFPSNIFDADSQHVNPLSLHSSVSADQAQHPSSVLGITLSKAGSHVQGPWSIPAPAFHAAPSAENPTASTSAPAEDGKEGTYASALKAGMSSSESRSVPQVSNGVGSSRSNATHNVAGNNHTNGSGVDVSQYAHERFLPLLREIKRICHRDGSEEVSIHALSASAVRRCGIRNVKDTVLHAESVKLVVYDANRETVRYTDTGAILHRKYSGMQYVNVMRRVPVLESIPSKYRLVIKTIFDMEDESPPARLSVSDIAGRLKAKMVRKLGFANPREYVELAIQSKVLRVVVRDGGIRVVKSPSAAEDLSYVPKNFLPLAEYIAKQPERRSMLSHMGSKVLGVHSKFGYAKFKDYVEAAEAALVIRIDRNHTDWIVSLLTETHGESVAGNGGASPRNRSTADLSAVNDNHVPRGNGQVNASSGDVLRNGPSSMSASPERVPPATNASTARPSVKSEAFVPEKFRQLVAFLKPFKDTYVRTSTVGSKCPRLYKDNGFKSLKDYLNHAAALHIVTLGCVSSTDPNMTVRLTPSYWETEGLVDTDHATVNPATPTLEEESESMVKSDDENPIDPNPALEEESEPVLKSEDESAVGTAAIITDDDEPLSSPSTGADLGLSISLEETQSNGTETMAQQPFRELIEFLKAYDGEPVKASLVGEKCRGIHRRNGFSSLKQYILAAAENRVIVVGNENLPSIWVKLEPQDQDSSAASHLNGQVQEFSNADIGLAVEQSESVVPLSGENVNADESGFDDSATLAEQSGNPATFPSEIAHMDSGCDLTEKQHPPNITHNDLQLDDAEQTVDHVAAEESNTEAHSGVAKFVLNMNDMPDSCLPVEKVEVKGSWDGWVDAIRLSPVPARANAHVGYEGVYQMKPGQYEYKYVVNGNVWILNPAEPQRTCPSSGFTNNIMVALD
ncbi:hypothetical protein HK102_003503 [Quaeritorhiza haematococci]|nr:hypothetical protein HK102_003503 [Quaeritorhiza haematococci]